MRIEVEEGPKKVLLDTLPQIKILGVTIDEHLTWKSQVNQVKKKAAYALRLCQRRQKGCYTMPW